ncbi:MORN repeat-containing protein 3 [Electrophorus electricus]|uniref:MORN repeat-containing protein 3 n=1 Tax=Electrophorus electricus TaxID=8005 RepID=A0A4W4G0P9_ELEEL|nr:MORN repeat-containing protein 3 [Electrophorus electricus]
MYHLKITRKTEPLSKQWDRKAEKSGLRHTVYSVNGDEYTGEWLHNKKHGKGSQVWKKAGAVYDGDWKFGKRDGYGTLRKLQPSSAQYVRVYSGAWKNDKKEGYGTHFYSATACYEGEWLENERNGWGRMRYENGDIYEGQWLRDRRHGQGLLLLANHNRYEGSWEDGRENGYGRFYFLDKGRVYEGFWVDGVPKCGTVCDLGRDHAPRPPTYPIPEVRVQDVDSVLMEGVARYSAVRSKAGRQCGGCDHTQPV